MEGKMSGRHVLHTAALTREVDGVSHRDSGAEAEHGVKRQHIFHTVLAHNHHYVVLSNSVSSQSTRHSPYGIACLWKRVWLAGQTINLQHHIMQHISKSPFRWLWKTLCDRPLTLTLIQPTSMWIVDALGHTLTPFLSTEATAFASFQVTSNPHQTLETRLVL